MSGSGARSPRCVFVGNIPFDTTEEQLIEKFSEVGPVQSFRLVFDRETGKPKGYGFCEYKDSETAMCAMRNLNGFELNGRSLRVDFAEKGTIEKRQTKRGGGGGGRAGRGGRFDDGAPFDGEGFAAPAGPPPPGVSHEQQVINILENMSTLQLYEMMAQMKTLVEQNRDQAREVLMSSPQFAFALLQAQVILGMVEPSIVQRILQQSQQPPPFPAQPGAPPFMQAPPPQMPMQPMQGGPPPFQDYPPAQPDFGMQPPPSVFPPQAPMPVVPPPQQQQQGQPPSLLDQQKLLLQQVMQLTPQQIEMLPLHQRQQVQQLQMQIKSQLGAGLGRP